MAKLTDDQQEQIKMAEELLFSGPKTVSFAKSMYFGRFRNDIVFPFPAADANDRQEADQRVAELREWLDNNLDADAIDRNAEIPRDVIDGLGKLGILGLSIPTEFAGQGASQYTYGKCQEEVARRCGATAVFINAHQSIGLKALVLFGTEEQKARYLPGLARGEQLAAFALTEPEAGSDASNVQTRAEFDEEKNVYRINGQKRWITNGGIADVLTLMARTKVETPKGEEDRITAFIVTPDMPGFEVVEKALEKVGIRGTQTGKLAFHDLEVPPENILGKKGQGLRLALTVLDFGRLTFAATCTGVSKELIERAYAHANTRRQFKQSLSHFALVKKKLALMSAYSYAMDAATYLTTGLMDRGEEDIMLETAIVKVFTSEALWDILYDTQQILGGQGFFCDEPYERMMRDARLNMIGEGANEVLRAFIGVVGMRDVGKALEKVLNAVKKPHRHPRTIFKFIKDQMARRVVGPTVPVRSSKLKKIASGLSSRMRKFGLAVQGVLVKYQELIMDEQLVLDRIADASMALYTATAVISKLDATIAGEIPGPTGFPAKTIDDDIAIGTLYCHQAFNTIDNALRSLSNNHDKLILDTADRLRQHVPAKESVPSEGQLA